MLTLYNPRVRHRRRLVFTKLVTLLPKDTLGIPSRGLQHLRKKKKLLQLEGRLHNSKIAHLARQKLTLLGRLNVITVIIIGLVLVLPVSTCSNRWGWVHLTVLGLQPGDAGMLINSWVAVTFQVSNRTSKQTLEAWLFWARFWIRHCAGKLPPTKQFFCNYVLLHFVLLKSIHEFLDDQIRKTNFWLRHS